MENMSIYYSCADGTDLSGDSVTFKYWSSEPYSDTSLASAIVSLCFIIVGLPCNLLIIFGILKQRLYTQPTYILLLNLAISDLLACVLVLPLTVFSGFTGEFILGSTDETRCRVCQTGITLYLFTGFSLHCLSALSLDRFLFIKFPLRYFQLVTTRRTIIVTVTLWLLNIFLSILPLFGLGDIFYQNTIATCTAAFSLETSVAPNYLYVGILGVISLPPLSLIIIANIWILVIVKKHIRKLNTMKDKSQNKEEFIQCLKNKVSSCNKQLQLIRVFGAIFVANMLSWSPFILIALLTVCNISLSEWQAFVIFSSIMSYVVLHPTIQACLIPEFRDYIVVFWKKILCRCKMKSSLPQFCSRADIKAGSPDVGSSECKESSCCLMLSITVLPVRDELSSTGPIVL